MDIATIGLSVLLVTAPGSGPAPPPPRVIASALARAAQEPATVVRAERLARRVAPQPPLRMRAPRGSRGALVALGAVVGAYAGAYIGEEVGENGWAVGLPLGAVAGGVFAFLATK